MVECPDAHPERLATQLRTLYTLTPAGDLDRVADVDPAGRGPAPLLVLGRTRQGNRWKLRHDLPGSLRAELDALCQQEPRWDGLDTVPHMAGAVRALLPETQEWRGPAYWLPSGPAAGTGAMSINAEMADALDAFPRTQARVRAGVGGPVAAVLVGGQAVSVCSCARLGPDAAEAGLHTLDDFRGQGHGLAAAALWAELVRQSGRQALYSTSWDNHASQAVARRLGAVLYAENWSLSSAAVARIVAGIVAGITE